METLGPEYRGMVPNSLSCRKGMKTHRVIYDNIRLYLMRENAPQCKKRAYFKLMVSLRRHFAQKNDVDGGDCVADPQRRQPEQGEEQAAQLPRGASRGGQAHRTPEAPAQAQVPPTHGHPPAPATHPQAAQAGKVQNNIRCEESKR
ncbi:hypothetical protein CEXT_315601 [Caerostris extrusa]|uniref:Uncharacterized protein n=1 Tax=Caerostris extrusa TaxID=172846 RepID=A0AAV4WQK1_CAEEX|nr:hypothetical protein CEXT_315601 [Caerostris extrusa]